MTLRGNMMIFNREKKTLEKISENKDIIYFVVISIALLIVRLSMFRFWSGDYVQFLRPWYDKISQLGGLSALRKQVGNYAIPYQFFIALCTYIPVKSLYLYKLFSVFFDYLLAFYAAKLAKLIFPKLSFLMVYSAVLALPTVIFNSATWAQADSIYSAFVVIALYELIQRKYLFAFIFWGIAFAFKLQAVFILPLFVLVYVVRKDFSILYFLISLLSFYACNLPGFLYGRSLLAPIKVYLSQAGNYPKLDLNYPNFTVLTAINPTPTTMAEYNMLHSFLLLFALVVIIIGYMFVLQKFENNMGDEKILQLAIWTFWTCIMFMPSMHERYGYVIDVLLVILSAGDRRVFPIAVISIMNSLIAYCYYLFNIPYNQYFASYVIIAAYAIFSFYVVFSSDARVTKIGKKK